MVFDRMNDLPIWSKKQSDLTEDEYRQFYKVLTKESWSDYMHYKHFSLEGQTEFKSIVFIPKMLPCDMQQRISKRNNIKLYVNKVYITDDASDICPEWLSFVNGVVDSSDLPLTISRENFQQAKVLKIISKNLVKKCIEMINELESDKYKYETFYREYSKNLKMGVHDDAYNRQKLLNLLRFRTSFEYYQSLSDYCSRVKDDKLNIYYLSGDDNSSLNSPFAEKCLKKGYEVIYMTEIIDEHLMQNVTTYDYIVGDVTKTFKFVSLTKEGFEDDTIEEPTESFDELCKYIKELLCSKLEKVVKSSRLEETPCVIVTGQVGYTARMEQIIHSQSIHQEIHPYMKSRKTLELNTNNKIIKELNRRILNGDKGESTKNLTLMLYRNALLLSGFPLEDQNEYIKQINQMIELNLNLNDDTEQLNSSNESNECKNDNNTENLNCSIMDQVD